jgi:FlaA1/EpsC-like NDP-sugar epimerase
MNLSLIKQLDIARLIGRKQDFFDSDVNKYEKEISEIVKESSFLVIGGAGSIGQQVVKEIFKRKPKKLHIVDINENDLVELVRDIRSSLGYIKGEFKTYVLDVGGLEYDAFIENNGRYDYILNLSALKHVRSEKDPFTLMRMIDVNILNTEKTLQQSIKKGVKKYFCVSTDKATKPVNMMGASKRIMELYLMRRSLEIPVSTARFANVIFSNGSLLYGFMQRIQKKQPLSAPMDVKRYFITEKESGQLCLMSALFGENRDIFFPKLTDELKLISFYELAIRFLEQIGYQTYICESEEQARKMVDELSQKGKWPCYFFHSDTTGEKEFEEFFTADDILNLDRFKSIGVIKNKANFDSAKLDMFVRCLEDMKKNKTWTKEEIVNLFYQILSDFEHKETGKYLDNKM